MFFRTVPSANTLVRRVNENAFASVVQARPCPAFGRPVHLRGRPIDYSPVLLLMPFGFHLAMDTLPSGEPQVGGFRSALAGFRLSLSCPFRLLHTFHLLRPARGYPRVWIWHPSFGRQRDFDPPEQRAAQRTLRARPSPSRLSPDFPVSPVIRVPAPPISRRGEEGFSSCSVHPCHRAAATAPPECPAASVSWRRSMLPSPYQRGLGL